MGDEQSQEGEAETVKLVTTLNPCDLSSAGPSATVRSGITTQCKVVQQSSLTVASSVLLLVFAQILLMERTALTACRSPRCPCRRNPLVRTGAAFCALRSEPLHSRSSKLGAAQNSRSHPQGAGAVSPPGPVTGLEVPAGVLHILRSQTCQGTGCSSRKETSGPPSGKGKLEKTVLEVTRLLKDPQFPRF